MSRKRSDSKRERKTAILGTSVGVVSEITVTYDSATEGFEISNVDPRSLKSEVFFERESGKDKILLSVPARSDLPAFDAWRQIVGQVSYLFAVDTNTRTVSGRRVSVSVACFIPARIDSLERNVSCGLICGYALFDVAPGLNPECLAWHLLFRNHILPARFQPKDQVGVVVDSELGLLPHINARTKPYYDSFHLPSNVRLIYSSSDADSGTLPSQMLRGCDTRASKLFDQLMPKLNAPPPLLKGDGNYSGYLALNVDQFDQFDQ